MKYLIFLSLFLLYSFQNPRYDKQAVDEFVLQSKQIRFNNFPGSLNPSIIRWNEGYLLSFRIRDPVTNTLYGIGLVPLDKNFNPIASVSELKMPRVSPNERIREQDPRLITTGEKLFIVYSSSVPGVLVNESRKMFIGEILFNKDEFAIGPIEGPLSFSGENEMRQEKNWTPFEYKG